jgi:hypothetical protein
MKCKECKKICKELFECDCAEYSELCEECWFKVPNRHRENVCFVDWGDYYLDRDESSLI